MKAGPGSVALLPVCIGIAFGLVIGVVSALLVPWQAATLLGWDVAAGIFVFWVWSTVGGLDSSDTARIATREDPSARVADCVILVAGVACLGAVGLADRQSA